MKIPISFLLGIDNFNADNYFNYEKNFFPKKLEFEFVDKKRFPIVSILKNISKKTSLFESLLVSSNDMLVEKFLNKKINSRA